MHFYFENFTLFQKQKEVLSLFLYLLFPSAEDFQFDKGGR